jgi:hypothetical protein
MAEIDVETTRQDDSYEFQVTVREGRSETRHRVALKKSDYAELVGEETSPEALVEESFRFLLEREPKESILRSFDLLVIARYFPEYRREIAQRL